VIIASIQEKGWIRTEYDSKANCWTIRYAVRRKTIKGIIYDWIMKEEIRVGNPNFRLIHTNYDSTFVYNREIEKFLTEKNYRIEKHCLNCRHSVWAVGLGQGFFCLNKDKIAQGGDRVLVNKTGFTRFMISHRDYISEFYEPRSCSFSHHSKGEK
jgi:hypothetical protein